MQGKPLILMFAFASLSAEPPKEPPALRAGIQLLEAGEYERSLPLLEAAAERTADPGLVAFDRGVALAKLGHAREAELQFLRCLDDAEIPAVRKAKALYNRGVCLMERDELAALRAAVDSFASCREVAADSALAADARHNLEIAKVRWLQLRSKEKAPPTPNDFGGDDAKGSDVELKNGEANGGSTASAKPKPAPSVNVPGGTTPKATPRTAPGVGTLPVLRDDAKMTPLSPEDTQRYLELTAERLARQRRSVELQRGGPDRPGVRDW